MAVIPIGGYNPADFQFGMGGGPGFDLGMGGPGGNVIGAPTMSGVSPVMSPSSIGGAAAPSIMGAKTGATTGGFGLPQAQLAMSGLQTLGNLWGAFQAAKMAKRQFNFTRDTTETNMANQIRSYNTQLEDRSRSRALVEGQTPEQAQAYIDRNKAVR